MIEVSSVNLDFDQQYGNASLQGRTAVVTGASSGIGRAIAVAMARRGASLCLVGRNPEGLAETALAARACSEVATFQLDLTKDEQLHTLVEYVRTKGRLDILIHSAGIIRQATLEDASIDDFDRQYAINVRAPYVLSQQLLPFLEAGRGQIVFINSSLAIAVRRPEVGQYAATKQALRAIADSLREELNPKGIRVLTLYLGRTATPMQEGLHRLEKKEYQPETFLQPADVASVVVQAVMLPSSAEITDVSMRPMKKTY